MKKPLMRETKSDSHKPKIAVVVPAFRVKQQILAVLSSLSDDVTYICVVDDACPDGTGDYVLENFKDKRLLVLRNETNTGVGGAVKKGFEHLMQLNVNVIVKLDGDGQMDPRHIPHLVLPILNGEADYTKGNRFYSVDGFSAMPRIRLIGNIILSFLSKAASGYWNIFDPNNGFLAISSSVLRQLDLEKISNRYFFESDMLFRLNLLRAKVVDVPMTALYGEERSNLSVWKAAFEFPYKHLRNLVRRLLITYFLRDFSVPSIQLLLGTLLTLLGSVTGLHNYFRSQELGISTAPGTLILFAVLMFTGIQLLISFISHDIQNVPTRSISRDIDFL